jgi:fucose permease
MSEGEVLVSLAGIITPAALGALAGTAATWRATFVLGAGVTVAAALAVGRTGMPPAQRRTAAAPRANARAGRRLPPTLVIVLAIVALEFSLSFWLASYLNDDVGLARTAAVAAVSGLYASSLVGRLLASRLARRIDPERLLAAALGTALAGLPILLCAMSGALAAVGIAVAGLGIGAMFPLTSALHVGASRRSTDGALGEILSVAAIGQLVGPLVAGAIAQAANLRVGLIVLPILTLIAAAGLYGHEAAQRRTS